jgi:dTDP-4-amino-4,6-dideoxygalactose transaminase
MRIGFARWRLHGQSKSALEKTTSGQWTYDDVLHAGYKCNMTDIQAALGTSTTEENTRTSCARRKEYAMAYHEAFRLLFMVHRTEIQRCEA